MKTLIIEMAGNVYECDRCVRKHEISLREAAKYMKEVSQIDAEDWDLLKLATALVYICCPEEKK
jgi:nucleolar protein 58